MGGEGERRRWKGRGGEREGEVREAGAKVKGRGMDRGRRNRRGRKVGDEGN